MSSIIGLDLGTTTVTGVLFDVHAGLVRHEVQVGNAGAIQGLVATRAEQDPAQLRELALGVLAELAAQEGAVDGIAVTGQMPCLICVDGGGEPLTNLISWQDRRTAEPLAGGTTALDRIHQRLGEIPVPAGSEEPWKENGCRISHGYGAAALFWLVQSGKLPPGTRRVCTLPDWIASQLTGRLPVTDATLAASWGVFSLLDSGWNACTLDRLGLDAGLLPAVVASGQQLGGPVAEVTRTVGLASGTPVHNALGDNQASFVGSVNEAENSVMINLGTGGQVCWMAPGIDSPSEAVETRPLPGRRSLRVGASLCGGAAYAWLNRTVRSWLGEFGAEVDEGTVYERLNALAETCEDGDGIRVQTTFQGMRGKPEVEAGAIEGITLDNLQLGALARATLIGMVDELRELYVPYATIRRRFREIVASGGAVTLNPLLRGLIEERFGLPVRAPRWAESAAVGAALVAARSGQPDTGPL
jgi:sedoheptulokinase